MWGGGCGKSCRDFLGMLPTCTRRVAKASEVTAIDKHGGWVTDSN